MRFFGISLISSTHSNTVTNVKSTSSKVKETPIMLLYREGLTLFLNKSTVNLTFGLIGVLTKLADSKPNFFTRVLGHLD